MTEPTLVLVLDAIGDVRNDIGDVRRENVKEIRRVHERIDLLAHAVARLEERTAAAQLVASDSGEHVLAVRPSVAKRVKRAAPAVGAAAGGGALVVALIEVVGPLLARLIGGG